MSSQFITDTWRSCDTTIATAPLFAAINRAADWCLIPPKSSRRERRQGRTPDEARALLAREIMTPGCATCDKGMLLSEAVSLMTGRRMHRLVVTENDRPIGVLSMTDVVRKILA